MLGLLSTLNGSRLSALWVLSDAAYPPTINKRTVIIIVDVKVRIIVPIAIVPVDPLVAAVVDPMVAVPYSWAGAVVRCFASACPRKWDSFVFARGSVFPGGELVRWITADCMAGACGCGEKN